MTARPQTEDLALTAEANGADIPFSRPAQRNAINGTVARKISATVDWHENQSVNLVILRRAGRNFYAGGDIKERHKNEVLEDGEGDPIEARNIRAGEPFIRLSKLRANSVVLMEGAAFGGGNAGPTDITVLTHGVQPGTPETGLLAMPVMLTASMLSYARKRVAS